MLEIVDKENLSYKPFEIQCTALNDPKWPWTLKGQMYPIYMLQLPPESQISLNFALRLAIFKLQAILRQVHWMTPNDLKH